MIVAVQSVLFINLTICSLYSLSQETNTIIKNSRNIDLLRSKDSIKKEIKSYSEEIAFSLILNRLSKIKSDYIIDRYKNANIVLSDTVYNTRYCTVSIDFENVAVLHKQSKNSTIINEKIYKDYSVLLLDKIKIELRKIVFLIQIL